MSLETDKIRHSGAGMRKPEQVSKKAIMKHFGARMRKPKQVSEYVKLRHF